MNKKKSFLGPQSALSISRCRFNKIAALTVMAVAGSVSMSHATGVVVDTNSLTVAPNGLLNLGNGAANVVDVTTITQNAVIVRSATVPAQLSNVNNIRGWLNSAYAGGLWTGKGISSGVAIADAQLNGVLGVMMYDNDQTGFTNFYGKDLPANLHQVMLRMTYAGDYDADGFVTPADYGFLDFYFSQGLNAQGDIDGDGMAAPSDYGLLDFTFGQAPGTYGNLPDSFIPPPAPAGINPVPEPGAGVLLLCGAGWLLNFRKRKQNDMAAS